MIMNFSINDTHDFLPYSLNDLMEIKFNYKMNNFNINLNCQGVDPLLAYEFIKKTMAPYSSITFSQASDEFKKVMYQQMSSWHPRSQRPRIIYFE